MKLEILTIEVGSTITKANGFGRAAAGAGGPRPYFVHLAQGFAPTSVAAGDVGVGVAAAIADLEQRWPRPLRLMKPQGSEEPEIFVNSSAAGGLRMTVHGLTQSMTVRAAREAALGAGAIVKLVTAGRLSDFDLDEIRALRPNIILLAGGVDFGEAEIVLRNAERLAALKPAAPVLYAGNAAIRGRVRMIFEAAGVETMVADNVFPEVDVLNIEPVRRLIHEVFNRHIVHAPGMARLGELTHWGILPTPGAVLRGAELFAEELGDCGNRRGDCGNRRGDCGNRGGDCGNRGGDCGNRGGDCGNRGGDCLVFDVGGATSDVHSVTDGSLEWAARTVEPEPRAKRTVEGDLGVFVNARNIVALNGDPAWADRLSDLRALPETERQIELTRWLCLRAVETAIRRHAGVVTDLYTPTGKRQIVKGKDLTAIRWVVGTGGALTRVPGGEAILRAICTGPGKYLLPPPDARILIDRDYRFSALGTLAQAYPEEVRATFRRWVDGEMGR